MLAIHKTHDNISVVQTFRNYVQKIKCSSPAAHFHCTHTTGKNLSRWITQNTLLYFHWPVASQYTSIQQSLQWRHNDRGGVSNTQPHECLLNRSFRCRSQKISKLRYTGLCAGNSPLAGEFPAQRASNAEKVSIWWRHHDNLQWLNIQIYNLHSCANTLFI